jgi:Xaa-Pro aminopeptidase
MLTNRERLASYMKAGDIEAVVSWSPVNVRYLTGYWCWLAPLLRENMVSPGGSAELAQRNVALFPLEGEPCLVLEPLWALNAAGSWVEDVRVAGNDGFIHGQPATGLPARVQRLAALVEARRWPGGPFEALADAVHERGLAASRIGVDLDGANPSDRDALRSVLRQAQLLNCSNLLRLVRAQKTEGEIAALERAGEIAEAGVMVALDQVGAGCALGELSQEFRARVASGGADFDHLSICVAGIGYATDASYKLPVNEAFYLDFGCVNSGWFSDSGLTVSIGDYDQATAEQYEAVRDSILAGTALLRPGVRASSVQAAMVEVLADRGISESFPHGHGLGLEVRDYPLIMPAKSRLIRDECVELSADLLLEPDMVVNLEAPVLTPGVRSVHCEQTFVITAEGCRPLVAQDREHPVLVG